MAETQTLNFGPEWLRALSGGGGGGSGGISTSTIASPPLSPALPKYKLADYRYGREEMLALYVKENKIPVDLHDREFLSILQEDPLPPLALVPFTEEEQRNFSMPVNSAAVLRLTGRGGGPVAITARGRSSSRGRGKNYPPPPPPPPPLTSVVRANYEDGGTGLVRKHDFTRSESENWRTSREEQNGEDDDGGWRLAGSRRDGDRWCPPSPDGPRSAGWREHPEQRRRFPFDARGDEERGYRRPRSGSGSLEDERDTLPEWCLEDAEEETGMFDSSGAFHSLKKVPKEPILEEVELDFRPLEECEEHSEKDESETEETKETDAEAKKESERSEGEHIKEAVPSAPQAVPHTPPEPTISVPQSHSHSEHTEGGDSLTERPPDVRSEPCKAPLHTPTVSSIVEGISLPHATSSITDIPVPSPAVQSLQPKPLDVPISVPTAVHFAGIRAPINRPSALPNDVDEDEGLKHFEQEAEKMVAYLQDGVVDDDRISAKGTERPSAALPITHEAALKWFYKDPQGEIQGPFSNQEMTDWFQAGYFTMTLLVKRGCDEVFQPLGEIIKIWGRVPFAPGPAPPPILGDVDQERIKRQQELTALNIYQIQQLQYQYLLRQQYVQAQALAQQKAATLSSTPQQQQQQLNLLLHQALKLRSSDALLPPVTRSMSVPDSGSVWEMPNSSSQASCTPNMPPSVPSTAWEGSSVWDLPIDSVAPAQTIEQIQHLEKANALKVWNTTFRTSESHSLYREEALRRQKEQEEVQRRHKEEEEERLAQEEAHRRMEEKRREEAEKRQREEFLRKQKQEERQKQEELEALRKREEEKRLEEEEAAAAAAALVRQQEEQRRRDQEVQRQQELQKQRQQQQEALRRLQQQQQQQQLAQMKLPSTSKWGQQSVSSADMCQSQNALSLSEIQKLEEKRERLAREEHRRQQQELLKAQQQQQQLQAQAKLPGWGSVAKQPAATKSLLEIQREEAQQMKQRKEQQLQSPAQQNRMQNRTTTLSSSVWGVSSTGSHWGSDSTSIWGDTQNSNMGFWDEAVKEAAQPPARKANSQKNKGNANLSNTAGGRANKKVEEEEKLLKLFQGASKSQDGFMQWCEQTLHTLNTANNLDVPTFASFLKEVDSHYEVHDYVKAYLGDTPQAKDFAKQFLERRAKQNANQQKPHQGQLQQDSVWGVTQTVPQAIFQSNHSSFQQQRFETVTSGKKKKKQKMVRADPSLLGFSVNASSERLNMGEIETVEDF
uniref:GYF domain-containing protein n=1 Tax=Denticeps clupeoides TaxID=299321 RepID=A0AAY4EX69_9TELE